VNPGIFGFPRAGNVVEQFFDAPGTYAWTRPDGAIAIYYEICGAGGGGSGGQLGQVSTANRFGARGGSAGEFVSGYLYGSQIPSGGQVVVPAGGSGGSSSAAQNSSGQSHGIAGAAASFCGVLFAAGGATGSAAGGFNWSGDGAAETLGNPHAGRRGGAGSLGADGVAAPGSGIYPGQVQADDPRKSALYFGKEPAVVSTFGLPNVGETGIQPFFGVNFPFISSRPWRFAREGEITSASADYLMGTGGVDSFQVRVKGSGTLPSWVTVPFTSGFSSDIDLAPAVGDAGIYELEVVVTAGSLQTVEPYTVVVLPATSEVLVNEFNAVSSLNRLNGGVIPVPADGDGVDTFFGTVDGNGGDWLELVVVGNGLAGTTDLRGWKIEIDDGAGSKFVADDVIVLSQDPYWAAVPNGTILTITEKTSAEGGLDTWIHKVNRLGQAGGSAAGDGAYAWSNIHYLDPIYIDQTASSVGDGLGISSNNTQIRILKPRSGTAGQFDVVAGPVGEGVQPLAGVNNTEVLELEVDPSPTVSPYLPDVVTDTTVFIYDDGNGSTFGSPNRFTAGTQAQNFSSYQTANSAPTFANSPLRIVEAGAAYSYSVATADAEDQGVTVSVVQKPDWLSFSNGVLSGTAPVGGTGLVELLATDSLGAATTLKYQLTVPVTDEYAQYLASKGLAAGTAFDARVNGVQVGLMYAFGTATGSPANNGVVAVPTMSGNTMTYVFDVKNDSALGVTYQTSTDLVNWETAVDVGSGSGLSPIGYLKKQVQVSGSGKLFIKLNVTR
jgi:hypothetical protein